jgi:hypothetical protein
MRDKCEATDRIGKAVLHSLVIWKCLPTLSTVARSFLLYLFCVKVCKAFQAFLTQNQDTVKRHSGGLLQDRL